MLVDVSYQFSPYIYLRPIDRYNIYMDLYFFSETYKTIYDMKYTVKRYADNYGEFIFRMDSSYISSLTNELQNKNITINNVNIMFDRFTVKTIEYHSNLDSSFIIFIHSKKAKYGVQDNFFIESLNARLKEMKIDVKYFIDKKKYIDIKGYKYYDYPVVFNDLNERESILIQTIGMGGKQKLECGIFTEYDRNR